MTPTKLDFCSVSFLHDVLNLVSFFNRTNANFDPGILTRASFFGYWWFDNLLIMSKLKIYSTEASKVGKKAMYFWWFANLFNIVNSARKLLNISAQEKYYTKLITEAPEKKDLFKDKFTASRKARAKALRGLIKSSADFMTASKGSGKFSDFYKEID